MQKFKKRGDLTRVCWSKPKTSPRTKELSVPHSPSEDESDGSMQPIYTYTVEQIRDSRLPPIKVHVELDSCNVPMEVDTGALVSIMAETLYHKLWPRRGLNETTSDCKPIQRNLSQ